jgi:hypothetical protein
MRGDMIASSSCTGKEGQGRLGACAKSVTMSAQHSIEALLIVFVLRCGRYQAIYTA